MGSTGWDSWFWALFPTVVLGILFWFAMRAILRADRTERKAYAKIEAEERAKLEKKSGTTPAP